MRISDRQISEAKGKDSVNGPRISQDVTGEATGLLKEQDDGV